MLAVLRRIHRTAFIGLLLSLRTSVAGGDAPPVLHATVEEREVFAGSSTRVVAISTNQIAILNPVEYARPLEVIPEGSMVTQGQLLVVFDDLQIQQALDQLRSDLRILEADDRTELARHQRDQMELNDRVEQLRDQKAVVEAERAGLLAQPYPEDLRIAEGRSRLARQQTAAAEEDLAILEERAKRGLVSEREVQLARWAQRTRQAELEFALLQESVAASPVDPRDLRRRELLIENVNLDLARVEEQAGRSREAFRLQQTRRDARIENQRRRLAVKEEELRNVRVYAPRSGLVLYDQRFKTYLAEGSRPPKGQGMVQIVDPEALVFRGSLNESEIGRFAPGDPVELRLADGGPSFTGRLVHRSLLPRNVNEEEGVTWLGDSAGGGVKVFHITVAPDASARRVPLGVTGMAFLRSRQPRSGPAVPLQFVHPVANGFRVYWNGGFHDVSGSIWGPWFLFQDLVWLGRTLEMRELPKEHSAEEALGALTRDRLVVGGELVPLDAVQVQVPDLPYRDRRLVHVVDDQSQVLKGQVVARIDCPPMEEDLKRWEDRVEEDRRRVLSDRDSLALRERELRVALRKGENDLALAELRLAQVKEPRQEEALGRLRLQELKAEIGLEQAEAELAQAQRQPEMVSPLRLRQLERERTRANLARRRTQLERAALLEARQGLDLEQARLERLKQHVRCQELRQELEVELAILRLRLERSELDLARNLRNLNRRQRLFELLTVHAPASGQVRLGRGWDGMQRSILKPGARLSSRHNLMTISSASRMILRVSVDEQYFSRITPGMDLQAIVPSPELRTVNARLQSIDFVFEPQRLANQRPGLYDRHEPPGPHLMHLQVELLGDGVEHLQPGTIAYVLFPFAP